MSTTMNGSNCSNPLNPTAAKIGVTFAYCLIFVVSLVGNSFIGIVVYKTQTLRKPINYFIVNMAMSDLLYPIFWFPSNLTYLFLDSWPISGPLGLAMCKLVHFLALVSVIVSVQSLILIAVDRFGTVVYPYRSPLITSKMCPFIILGTWIVASAVIAPYLFAFNQVEYPGKRACEGPWNEAFGESSSLGNRYALALYVAFFYAPIASLVILYSIIILKLKSQKIPGEQSDSAEKHRAKRNGNVLKMAIAIVLGFVLCWVPVSIARLRLLFAWESRDSRLSCDFYLYHRIAFLISFSSCAINPCICFTFSGNYRQGLKRLLKCFN